MMHRIPQVVVFLLALVPSLIACNAHGAASAANRLKALLDLKPGEWRELPDTKMSSVFPPAEKTTWGVLGPAAVVRAWGGAAFDTKRNAFVFNGGGHTDYGGNEVYAFFLDELRWERLTEPSPMRKLDSHRWATTDDTPVSAHTYDGLEYLPNVDKIFRNGGSEWSSGNNYDRSAWLFDMSRRRWERGPTGGGEFVTSAFDPVRGTVYVLSRHAVDEYDPTRNQWIPRLSREASFTPNIGAIDPENRRLFSDTYPFR